MDLDRHIDDKNTILLSHNWLTDDLTAGIEKISEEKRRETSKKGRKFWITNSYFKQHVSFK